ncbi:MAG: InlB B-repeat-containing protein, partial [Clostridia bacterium]|nr:InlB B-repeat-containing protein [Clostridia bacterium]
TNNWYTDISCEANKAFNASTAITENKDLYAKRENKTFIAIEFITEKGTVDPSSIEGWATIVGMQVQLPTLTCEGHTFAGWYSSAETAKAATDNGRIGDAGDTYTATANTTLYAGWTVNTYTITVSTTDATVSVTNGQKADYGATITFTVSYDKDGSKSTTVTDAIGNTLKSGEGTSFSFTMPASNVTINAKSEDPCFAAGTLITMADGTLVPVEQLKPADFILSYDFETGAYVPAIVAEVTNHGEDYYEVVTLTFSDNSTIRIIASHGFFNVTEMKYLDITTTNYEDYIGHNFMAYDGNGNTIIKELVSATVTTEITTSYSLTAAIYINAIADGLITITPPMTNWYNMFVVDDNLKWNEELMAADIAQYGLFTYEEVEHLIPYEIFVASNFKYFKVAFAKGLVTMDEIEAFVAWYNELIESGEIVLGDMSQYLPPRETTTTDVAEATLPPQVVTGDEQQQDTVEESIE